MPIRHSDNSIRVINLGGGEDSSSRKSAEMIEIGTSSYPLWKQIPAMSYERHDAPNALLLPDGKLIVIGGVMKTRPYLLLKPWITQTLILLIGAGSPCLI